MELNVPVAYVDPAVASTGLDASVKITAVAAETCLRTYELTYNNPDDGLNEATHTFTERAGFPRVRTGNIALDAAYAWSIEESTFLEVDGVENHNYNGGALVPCAEGGCYKTGANWSYVWTRDTAYAAALGLTSLDPVRVKNSMEFKVSERRSGWYDEVSDKQILQDTGTGGSYPVSTDRTSWAVGASAVSPWLPESYKEAFDALTYEALKNTIEHDRQVVFNTDQGLYTGETSFMDWRWQTYPSWIGQNMNRIAESISLSTNVTHWQAINDVAELAETYGTPADVTKYRGWADDLAADIDAKFWLAEQGQYSSLITGELDPSPTQRFDALATALVVLSGIAPQDRAAAAVANYPQTPFGASTIWPNQNPDNYSEYGSYHNDSIWPFVVAFMNKAAVKVGNDVSQLRQFDGIVRMPLIYGSNYENYNINTPGSIATRLNSKFQTWSVAGLLGAFQEDLFGIRATQDGLTVDPFVTAQLRGKYLGDATQIRFENLTYLDSSVNVTINLPADDTTEGAYEVTGLTLNGDTVATDAAFTTAQLGATAEFTVTLGDAQDSVSAAAVKTIDGEEGQYGPNFTYSVGVTPDYDENTVTLNFHQNWQDTSKFTMDILRDGQVIASDIENPDADYVDTTAEPNRVSHCYTTRLKYKSSGNYSQPSAASCIWGPGYNRIQNISSTNLDHNGGEKRESNGRQIIGGWGGGVSDDATTPVMTVPTSGRYLAAYEYFLGVDDSVNDGLSAGIKMLDVVDVTDGGNDVIKSHTITMASRGSWGDSNESTFVPVDLAAGREYKFRLRNDRLAVNMGYFQANAVFSTTTAAPFGYIDLIEFKLLGKELFDTLTAGTVAIDGDARVGEPLTATPGNDWPEGTTFTYQWADGDGDIDGATESTFTPTAAQIGADLTVTVTTATLPAQYGPVSASATSDPVGPVAPKMLIAGTVSIAGNPAVGDTLTAVPAGWQDGVTLSYQWFAGEDEISGATADVFEVTGDQVGAAIKVTVTGTASSPDYGDPAPAPVTATSTPTAPVAAQTWNPGTAAISGTPEVGQTLTAAVSGWPAHVDLSYQWRANGADIAGATGATLVLTAANIGASITVRVTGVSNDDSYGTAPQSVTSAAVGPVAPKVWAGNTVTIAGDAIVGERLTAIAGEAPDGTGWQFEWLADGDPIVGATGYYLDLTANLIGSGISARVTWTLGPDYAGAVVSSTSSESDIVAPTPLVAGTVTIDGTAEIGQTLTAVPGANWPEGTTFTYQWSSVDGVIAGATAETFAPTVAQLGETLTVTVTTASVPAEYGAQSVSATSAASTGVAPLPFVPGMVTIEGVFVVGETLTAVPAGWQDGVDLTYEWFANGVSAGTGPTLVLTEDLVGKSISVEVTGTPSAPQFGDQQPSTSDPIESGADVIDAWAPGAVEITGTARVGQTLAAVRGTNWPAHVIGWEYQWFADGAPIAGATSTTLTLTVGLIGKSIQVRVSGVSNAPEQYGHARGATLSVGTAKVAPLPLVAVRPYVTGVARVGGSLAVAAGRWAGGARLTYQWFANGVAIKGATRATLVLGPAHRGKRIAVRVTGVATDPLFAGSRSAATSTATKAVAAGKLPKAKVKVTGKVRAGNKVRAVVTIATSARPVKVSYRWFVGKKRVKKATKARITVKRAWVGKKIRVKVTVKKAGYKSVKATSKAKKARR